MQSQSISQEEEAQHDFFIAKYVSCQTRESDKLWEYTVSNKFDSKRL